MIAIKTNVLDSNAVNNNNASKILLMDRLIEYFSPLFYEDLRKKQRQVHQNEIDIKKLKGIIEQNKTKLQKIQNDIKIETTKKMILAQVDILNNIDVLYGKNKTTVQGIITTLDTQNLANLETRLTLLQKLVKRKEDIK